MRITKRRLKNGRRGAAAVEAALLAPVLVLTTLGAIDVAQYINLAQLVANASREGARTACRSDTTSTQEVRQAIEQVLADSAFKMSEEQISDGLVVTVLHGTSGQPIAEGDLSTVESGEGLVISVSFDFKVVRWLHGPDYWDVTENTSKTFCRRE